MKVLIIGSGGREHALAWKAAQSPLVSEVLVAPGNAGTAREARVRNVNVGASDIDGLISLVKSDSVGLTIVGPEVPLAAGVVDRFKAEGLACFGPTKAAAQLEASKAFAKKFMKRNGIPTAAWEVFHEPKDALDFARQLGFPVVIKADGLAAGKGVVIAENDVAAASALNDMLNEGVFGQAGARVIVEEFLTGEEASFIAISDGKHILPLASSQDHKQRDDGDRGPNTGGMGAYSPAPAIDKRIGKEVIERIMLPTLDAMAAQDQDNPFIGFLYAGLMITDEGPKVLEFNVRFGDPETQPVLMRMKSDLVAACRAALDGKLDAFEMEWDDRAALGVVAAAGGYPGAYDKGDEISGLNTDFPDHVKVFHAGTAEKSGEVVTAGGRVLCVTALGADIADAQREAYQALGKINFRNMYYRQDIGHRALER